MITKRTFIRRYFFILLCFLAVGISCSKKSDPAPAVGCLITKSTITFSAGSSQVCVYNYDNQGILTGYTFTLTNPGLPNVVKVYTYTYAGGALASITEATQGGATIVATWTQDASRRVTKITTNGTPTSEANCTYDSDGNLNTMLTKSGSSTVNITAHFVGGQLLSMNSDVSSPNFVLNGVFSYSAFDLKNNPWSLLAAATGQKFFTNTIEGNVNPEYLFKNNPGSDEYNTTGSGQSSHTTDTYTYEYNTKNYPTKITKMQAGGSTPLVTTFEYSNCN